MWPGSGVRPIHILHSWCFHKITSWVLLGEACPSAWVKGSPALTAGGVWWHQAVSFIPLRESKLVPIKVSGLPAKGWGSREAPEEDLWRFST